MPQADGVKSRRSAYLLGIVLASISLAIVCVAWLVGRAPSWPAFLLPLIVVVNGVAGLEVGPFRSPRVRRWNQGISIAASLCIVAGLVYGIAGRVR